MPLLKVAQTVKNLAAMQETWVRSLGWEEPLKEGMTTPFSILAWRIPMDRGARHNQRLEHINTKWVNASEGKFGRVPNT